MTSANQKKKISDRSRTTYYDVLNILATICVVWIHFGNEVHWYDGSKAWYWCLLIQVLCYWAVPVFLMLTGATLMDYGRKYSTGVFFKRRLSRTLVPYLFWGTILIVLKIHGGTMQLTFDGDFLKFQATVLDLFLHNKMEPIYWFFPVIFGIYLSMPVLTVLTQEQNRDKLNYTVIMGVLTISVIPFLFKMLQQYLGYDIWGWNGGLQLPVLGGYLLYPVLGYWASHRDFSKVERITIYVVALLCALLRYHGLEMLSVRDGVTNQLYMDYISFPALFLALGVFVFVRYFCERFQNPFRKASSVLSIVSSCSLGVYLIHNMILAVMQNIPFFGRYTLRWYFLWPFACYAFCLLVVYLVKKVPLIKRVFP